MTFFNYGITGSALEDFLGRNLEEIMFFLIILFLFY